VSSGLERLEPLIGEWTIEAIPPGGPPWPGEGRVSFEWLEGRTFLIQRWTVPEGRLAKANTRSLFPSDPDATIPGMERDQLKRWLDQGLSLPQIGELTGRDPSTVGYWVQKHGLIANGNARFSPRGGLTREQLEPLVKEGATLQEMARALDRSISTISRQLKKHGLKVTRRGGPHPSVSREDLEAARAAGLRSVSGRCREHGETEFALVGSDMHPRCKKCRAEAVARRRRKVKEILVAEAGGCCQVCGYDRHPVALHFHHLDPATKSFGLARRGVTRSLDKVRAEAAKCVLLCSNCHAEVEAGLVALTLSRARNPK
jgi:DNA-binding CsgD family transcriptional regulator